MFHVKHFEDHRGSVGLIGAKAEAQRREIPRGLVLCERAKAPDEFSAAAKLVLLVDVRGADDFRAKKSRGRPRLHGEILRVYSVNPLGDNTGTMRGKNAHEPTLKNEGWDTRKTKSRSLALRRSG
jgi:hypothetical protein